MKIAGVIIDAWKLGVFKKHLDAAGYTYTQHPGLTAGGLTLKVETETIAMLQPVVMAANAECRKMKR